MIFDNEKGFGVEFKHENDDVNTFCPFCEDEETSRTKSCSVSTKGVFNCKSCFEKGTVIDYYVKVNNVDIEDAIKDLTLKKPTNKRNKKKNTINLTDSIVDICHNNLLNNKEILKYLEDYRGICLQTIIDYRLGIDEERITIPVYDEQNTLVNIRRYLPKYGRTNKRPKMINHINGDGTNRLYPFNIVNRLEKGSTLVFCEGELDALLLIDKGIPAITHTGGVGFWNDEWYKYLKPFSIDICFDVNDKPSTAFPQGNKGQVKALELAHNLVNRNIPVKNLVLPISQESGDVTDWFILHNATIDDFKKLHAYAETITKTSESYNTVEKLIKDDRQKIKTVPLHECTHHRYYMQEIRVKGIIAGKGNIPYGIPFVVFATEEKDDESHTEVHQIKTDNKIVLELIDTPTKTVLSKLKGYLGYGSNNQKVSLDIHKINNLELIHMIPVIDEKEEQRHLTHTAYCIGNDLQTNKAYTFTGKTFTHPRSQIMTHVFTHHEPVESSIDKCELQPGEYSILKDMFYSPNIQEKFNDISKNLADHVTTIYGRNDLHIAVDLAYHSPLSFMFENKLIRKGWLEIYLLGDTRTGKGFVVENLMQHYRLGDMVSAESMSLAGLVGGVHKIHDKWSLVWGKLPLNDKRLVCIDECTALTTEDIGKLSRIRSEGIAEITKIVSERTSARTRLIWISNPRPLFNPNNSTQTARMISDFNYGIEAATGVIGSMEDIARFDFIIVLALNEVDTKIINSQHKITDELRYPSNWCNKLITWIWSRTPEQVIFDENVEKMCMQGAYDLGQTFTNRIPLLQPENTRFKLARIAAAAAGRTFSTEDGINLIVKKEHYDFAYQFLIDIYSKKECGYLQMSKALKYSQNTCNTAQMTVAVNSIADDPKRFSAYLLQCDVFSKNDMAVYARKDEYEIEQPFSELVQSGAIEPTEHYGKFEKSQQFKNTLRKIAESNNENLYKPE